MLKNTLYCDISRYEKNMVESVTDFGGQAAALGRARSFALQTKFRAAGNIPCYVLENIIIRSNSGCGFQVPFPLQTASVRTIGTLLFFQR